MNTSSTSISIVKYAAISLAVLIGLVGFSKFFGGPEVVQASASGPSASHTNAPGENSCTACHSEFPLNSGAGNVSISGIPANYRAGQLIPITVTATDPVAVVFGFQMTAIDNRGHSAGTFSFPPAVPQPLQILQGLVGGNQRNYIEHTIDGISPTTFGTKTWTFNWTAPAQRVGKIGFYVANNAANSDGGTNGDYIYATSKAALSGTAISNFDSDGLSDMAIWRPSSGTWYTLNSSDLSFQATTWGVSGDRIAPGDYDGDGKTDIAMWRPSSGTWYILNSGGGVTITQFGSNGDIPVPGDYDGDLKSDIAVWRPSTGIWYIYRSSDGTTQVTGWGVASDKIAQGDYDADGKTDIAVYRPSTGVWYILRSSDSTANLATWGVPGDRPVPGDYDGDGKHDLAIYRPSNGTWYIFNSSNSSVSIVNWGNATDLPVPADFDGDGKTDVAVYRNGTWYVVLSSTSSPLLVGWGLPGDIPIPSGYISD